MKGKTRYAHLYIQERIAFIYNIHTSSIKESIHDWVSVDKTINTLFHEQTVSGRGYKMEKAYLIRDGNITMWPHWLFARV